MPEDELFTLINEYKRLDNPHFTDWETLFIAFGSILGVMALFVGLFNAYSFMAGVGAVLLGVAFIKLLTIGNRSSDRQSEILAQVTGLEDVRSAGFFLNRVHATPDYVYCSPDIKHVLVTLLPRVKRDLSPCLNSEQLHKVYRLLADENQTVVLAALQAIEQIGECNALRYVTPLAQGKGTAKRNQDIHEKARACQQMLEERLQRLNQPQTLLRASAAPMAAREELVRPASATNETPVEQLLRVSAGVKTPR